MSNNNNLVIRKLVIYAAFQATCNSCFSNLLPVKVHWNGSQTRDFPPVNSSYTDVLLVTSSDDT